MEFDTLILHLSVAAGNHRVFLLFLFVDILTQLQQMFLSFCVMRIKETEYISKQLHKEEDTWVLQLWNLIEVAAAEVPLVLLEISYVDINSF